MLFGFASQAFYNLGSLLVSDNYIHQFDEEMYSPFEKRQKTIKEYKLRYIEKLQAQMSDLEKSKAIFVAELDELITQQKALGETIEWLNKKLIINKKYNNSATNFVISHNQRMNKKVNEKMEKSGKICNF